MPDFDDGDSGELDELADGEADELRAFDDDDSYGEGFEDVEAGPYYDDDPAAEGPGDESPAPTAAASAPPPPSLAPPAPPSAQPGGRPKPKVRPAPARAAARSPKPKAAAARRIAPRVVKRAATKRLGYETIYERLVPPDPLLRKVKDTKWPSSYDGGTDRSYAGIRFQVYGAFDKRAVISTDGTIAGPQEWPDLSNGELVALVQAWKRSAARSSTPNWPIAFDLLITGLGWRREGDRFVMTRAHARQPGSAAAIQLFWIATDELAVQLDAAGTKIYPLIVDWTYAGYEQAAREAWHQMQAERLPPLPERPPPSPIDPPSPSLPSAGGDGMLLLFLLVVALTSRKRR